MRYGGVPQTQDIRTVRNHVDKAIEMVDRLGLPANVGAHLDMARCRLLALGREDDSNQEQPRFDIVEVGSELH